ncbi:MAG: response regulator transcription factor [Chloroflexi bacterium]|nr:response regulator transcription factor [Chloroflexota bacterium]
MSKIGVYIAGQPSPFASRLALRLKDEPEVEIVGADDDGSRVIEVVTQLCPEVVLLETDLSDKSGVDGVKSFKDACPNVSVIVVSARDHGDSAPESFATSAPGSSLESGGGDDVLTAILQVFSGAPVADGDIFGDLLPYRAGRRIGRGDETNLSRRGLPSITRLKRYNVLISRRRACPGCYERRIAKRASGMPDPRYGCSGCGVRFVGAALSGVRVGIAERVSHHD